MTTTFVYLLKLMGLDPFWQYDISNFHCVIVDMIFVWQNKFASSSSCTDLVIKQNSDMLLLLFAKPAITSKKLEVCIFFS